MKTWQTGNGVIIRQLLRGRSNSFLIRDRNHTVMVDTGRRYSLKSLLNRIYKAGTKTVDYLILTHTHFDHAENAAYLKEHFGLQIIVHQNESELLKKGENPIVAGTILPTRFLARLLAGRIQQLFHYQAVTPDVLVSKEFDLAPLGIKGHILHTPGHTQGSMSVIIDNEIAIVGDTLFGIFPGSVFPPFGQDLPQMIESWGLLIGTSCKVFLPTHGSQRSLDLLSKQYRKYTKRMKPFSRSVMSG